MANATKRKIGKAYKALEQINNDCTKSIEKLMQLRKGILRNSLSLDRKLEMCDEIIDMLKA